MGRTYCRQIPSQSAVYHMCTTLLKGSDESVQMIPSACLLQLYIFLLKDYIQLLLILCDKEENSQREESNLFQSD